jgi:hypothetical protein
MLCTSKYKRKALTFVNDYYVSKHVTIFFVSPVLTHLGSTPPPPLIASTSVWCPGLGCAFHGRHSRADILGFGLTQHGRP